MKQIKTDKQIIQEMIKELEEDDLLGEWQDYSRVRALKNLLLRVEELENVLLSEIYYSTANKEE